ncbi:isoprenylcysteine carboxylmethyltransferase family protein [Pseudomonas sp. F1_0610]|uniref:methyltransferase family protein n=1 Tax=Pseudomonas sp. F1_0610 TaxID=3114284 RepID=UPI0039C3C7EA
MGFLYNRIPPPIVMLFSAIMMWVLSYGMWHWRLPMRLRLIIVVILLMLSMTIGWLALAQFKRAQTTANPLNLERSSRLVMTGVYRFSRNPMYLALALILLAWAVLLSSPFTLIGWAFFIFYITQFQIKPEERMLEQLFPEQYEVYRNNVRRWL